MNVRIRTYLYDITKRKFYGKNGLEGIRQEYPDEFNRMLERGYYQHGYEAWSGEYDEEALENAEFQLNIVSVQALKIGE